MARNPIARQIERKGEYVILRRQLTVTPATFQDVIVKARVRQYDSHELVGTIAQGDYEIIVAHATLEAKGFPVPPKKGDRVIINPTIVNGAWVPVTGTHGVDMVTTVQHPGYRGQGTGYWMQARG